ncbi:MAG: SDR family oxidoreductase [Solirubrobacterales bacterium]|nr:SDR family oxidoreductase [Solirubrobacterales bacterium]
MSGDLRDRVAIVTGGGRGIGRAIALGYARAGAEVLITAARNRDEAEAVADESRSLAGRVEAMQADVLAPDDIERLVERALTLKGRIDVLVNNAARGMRFVNERFMSEARPFWEADPDAWRMVMDTNTIGVFLVTRAVVPHMLAAGRGSIVNVTINEQTMVRRGFSPYGPSKAALEAMTEVWAQELEGTGVVINLLLPGGATATGMVPDDAPDRVELLSPEIVVPGAVHLALTNSSGQRIVGTEWPA